MQVLRGQKAVPQEIRPCLRGPEVALQVQAHGLVPVLVRDLCQAGLVINACKPAPGDAVDIL